MLALPRQSPLDDPGAVPSPGRTLVTIRRSGPLRRTLVLTVVVAFSVAALPIYAVAVAQSLGEAALAGSLVASYGIGTLAGSGLLMVRPLHGDADKLTGVLAAVVAAALLLVIATTNFTAALVAFGAAGIANSLFFAATLAARSEYAPPEARGQIFIWVGALKIAAGSADTAVAGALIGGTAWLPVAIVAALSTAAAAVCLVERSRDRT